DLELGDLVVGELGGEAEDDLELGRAPALGGGVLAVDLDEAEIPALALGVHLHGHGGARGKAGGEELLGAGALVVPAGAPLLVDPDVVVAHADDVLELPLAARGGLHAPTFL